MWCDEYVHPAERLRPPVTSPRWEGAAGWGRVEKAGLPPLRGKQHVNGRLSPRRRGDVLSLNLSMKPLEDLLHMDPLGPRSPSISPSLEEEWRVPHHPPTPTSWVQLGFTLWETRRLNQNKVFLEDVGDDSFEWDQRLVPSVGHRRGETIETLIEYH